MQVGYIIVLFLKCAFELESWTDIAVVLVPSHQLLSKNTIFDPKVKYSNFIPKKRGYSVFCAFEISCYRVCCSKLLALLVYIYWRLCEIKEGKNEFCRYK